jgi:muramidase (phage lysozyme)
VQAGLLPNNHRVHDVAGQILNVEFPEINPAGAPGDDYERIRSSPASFGAFGAEALKQSGEGLVKASTAGLNYLTEQNQYNNQIHASELHSWFSDQSGDLVSKHSELQGRAASDQLPDLKAKIADFQKQAEEQAGNLPTKAMVAGNTRRTMDWLIGAATKHADSQRTAWATKTAADNVVAASNIGGLAIQSGDYSKLDEQFDVIGREAHNYFDPMGYDDQTLGVEVAKYRGSAVKNWVETAATNTKDPDALTHALQIFERYSKDIDPASRLQLDKYVRSAAFKRTVDRLGDYYAAPMGRTVDGSLSPEMRGLLDTIHGSETPNGGYDTLYGGGSIQKVRPGFDYSDHPRMMFPAQYGPTSAFGRYQITKTTWDADKDRFGLTDITPESQDQWAAKKAADLYSKTYNGAAFKGFSNLTGNLDNDLAANRNNPGFLSAVGHTLSNEWTSLPGGLQPNAQTILFAQRFAKNIAINSGEAGLTSDPAEVERRIATDPLLADRPELRKAVLQDTMSKIAIQSRAESLAAKQAKEQSDATEWEVFKNIHGDKPTVTLAQIDALPMTKDAKVRMTEQLEKATGTEKTERTYGAGFYDVYRRVHLPESDPDRVTDQSQLYSHVGPQGDLTVAGVDKLVTEIQARKSPEGVAESEMKAQFLKNARAQITGTDEGLHIKDPKGDELYLKFLAQVLPQYDAQRKAGKSATTLFNPESPDYLGKAITGFRRPMDQWYADTIHDQAAPGRFDPAAVKSLDDLVAAYRHGDVDKATADALAIQKGWAVRKPPPAAMPTVPMSQ